MLQLVPSCRAHWSQIILFVLMTLHTLQNSVVARDALSSPDAILLESLPISSVTILSFSITFAFPLSSRLYCDTAGCFTPNLSAVAFCVSPCFSIRSFAIRARTVGSTLCTITSQNGLIQITYSVCMQ